MSEVLLVDVIVTWMGALGVIPYLVHIRRSATPSFLEKRTQFLLWCLAALLLLRGFAWLEPNRLLGILVFIPATLLPLAATFFVEALLRRHVPFAMKVWVSLGTVVFFFANVLALRGWHLAFAVFMAATFAFLAVLLLARRRDTLSPPENRLIDAVLLAALVSVPLTITDFRIDLELAFNRMGALGALVFVTTLVRMTTIASILVRAALLAAVMLVLRADLVAAASLSLGVVLLFAIYDGLRHLRAQVRGQSFLRWLAEAKTSSTEAFLESLKACPIAEEHVALREGDLGGYDVDALVRSLDRKGGVVRMTRLREDPEIDEQLDDLLETYGMSHVCLVSVAPPLLLLVNYPQLADAEAHELEMALIPKLGRLVRSEEAPAG